VRIQHWQDIASLLLGAWLVLSPWMLDFVGAAAWITVALGLFVILFAIEGLILPSYLEEWGEIALGLALLVAPWSVGYDSLTAALSSVVTGILVMILAVWEMMTDREFIAWWHDHWHHPA
jgi:hypothetical protein